jgi:hypothetical protein
MNRFALVHIQSTYLLNRGQYCTLQYTKILKVSEIYEDEVYCTVVSFFSLNVFYFSLAFFFSKFIPASLFLLPLYPYLLIPLYPYLLPLYPYLLIPLYPYLLPLYPYLLIPLFPFTRKRRAGIGKKIDWGSYREITTCPLSVNPLSLFLSLSLSIYPSFSSSSSRY